MGLSFDVRPASIDETAFRAPTPALLAERLAEAKARHVAERLPAAESPAVVLAADTIVVLEGEIFGKPRDRDDARTMLRRLSGRVHEVITGIACAHCGDGRHELIGVEHERTRVFFRPLSPERIEWYLATGEPFDKAGAYGIQGRGAALIERVEGCFFNVVGLPVARATGMLARAGIDLP